MGEVGNTAIGNNPDLTCIYVDDKAATYLADWTKDATATYVNNESECTYTYIPDENFRNRLTSLDIGVKFVGNYASTPTISGITSLDVHNRAIFDLTGIEDFAALQTLHCYKNGLTSLDLSKNTALELLNCSENQLDNLNVSKNTALTTLYCYNNKLKGLDVSKTIALTTFKCNNNKLKSLDISKNKALTTFACNDNELSTLDARNGKNSIITAFDATKNPQLTCIYVDDKNANLSAWMKDATAHFVNNEAECGAITTVNDIKKQSVSCYPNPTNGILNFDFAGEQVQNMKIVNIAGETVFQKANLNQNETIDMSAFANGLYLVTIQTDKENLSFKILKQ